MKKNVKLFIHLFFIGALTIVTQVGGLIYLLAMATKKRLKLGKVWIIGVFLTMYLLISFGIIPWIAPFFGRVALPLTGNLKPLNFATCILNRHYVSTPLKQQLISVADKMNTKFEGTLTNYLDANFPFFDGFPLFPHLSHNDGNKVDLAFYYKEKNAHSDTAPSFMGYGVYEDPRNVEPDYPTKCKEGGYWQYGVLSSFVPQWNKDDFQLDVERTKALIILLAESDTTSKIFVEPHLKERWQLGKYDKIRFHGCQAVRHDDHIHTQIK